MGLIDRIKLFFSTTERKFEPVFEIAEFSKAEEYPPFVRRKWKQLVIAMTNGDEETINALQVQLIDSGYPAPVKISEAKKLCQD